jgi:hypothetical protein
MKRLKLFFHELSRLDAAVLDTFPALKSMESPAEMLHYVQGIYVKVFEELKNIITNYIHNVNNFSIVFILNYKNFYNQKPPKSGFLNKKTGARQITASRPR